MAEYAQTLARDDRIAGALLESVEICGGYKKYQTPCGRDIWPGLDPMRFRHEVEDALFRAGGSYRMSLEFNAGEVLCQIQFLRFTQSGLAHMGCADNKADAFLNAAEEAVKHLKAENLL